MKHTHHAGLIYLFLATFFLTACQGDTGPAGPAGASGPPGPPGNDGPPGTSTAVPVESADAITATVTSVDVVAGGGTTTVNFRLTNDLGLGLRGLPASHMGFVIAQLSPGINGSPSEWQAYTTNGRTTPPDVQAGYESGSAGSFTDNGDGTYSYVFAQDLTAYSAGPVYDENKIHRVGFEIRTNRGLLPYNIPANNAPYDFRPASGPVDRTDPADIADHRLIVDNDTCNACHDNLELHGEARFDVDYCVQCHNPYSIDPDTAAEPWGGSVDMTVMIHKIHMGIKLANGYRIIGYGGTEHDYSFVRFTQDVRNCQTCHNDSDTNTPQASNWKGVPTRTACGACHDGIDWAGGGHPGGAIFPDDTQCAGCHAESSNVSGGALRVSVVHQLKEVIANEAFQYEVVSVTNTAPGQTPSVTIRVSNPLDGTTYDINDPTGPFQTGSSRLRLDIAWSTTAFGNLDPNDDLARAPDSGAPFAPIVIDFQAGAVDDGSGNFTKSASDAIPTGLTGSGIATLEGRAAVDIDGSLDNLPVSSNVYTFAITDTDPVDRRSIVDIDKCNDCHKNLALHGDNRSGSTEVCSTCHNPNATDINRRVPGSECDIELGLEDEPIDMKRMVHQIHAGTVGICGYRNSAHSYFGVVYPGRLNNCEGCHKAGTYYPVDPGVVLATSIDAGADRSTLVDDVAISPNSSVCSACHTSDIAAEHMRQNGGDFAAGKDDTGALISSGVETCQLCHGPGRSADVGEVHGVGTFQFN